MAGGGGEGPRSQRPRRAQARVTGRWEGEGRIRCRVLWVRILQVGGDRKVRGLSMAARLQAAGFWKELGKSVLTMSGLQGHLEILKNHLSPVKRQRDP